MDLLLGLLSYTGSGETRSGELRRYDERVAAGWKPSEAHAEMLREQAERHRQVKADLLDRLNAVRG